MDSATIIIRSSRERTEDLCKKLILQQGVENKNLFIVRETPFSASLRKSYRIGLEQNKTWTFCIDADVLLRPQAIQQMITYANNQQPECCGIQGLVLDKFFGGPRGAGNHLYKTSFLSQVIKCIPDEGDDIRPETYALQKMKKRGHPWLKIPYIVGLHDSEQYYSDIYRKCFVQGVKHVDRIPLFVEHWRNNIDDFDFFVALKALSHSLANIKPVFIDVNQPLFREGYNKLEIHEKPELLIDDFTLSDIEYKINTWSSPDIYYQFFPKNSGFQVSSMNFFEKVQALYKQNGFLYLVKYAFNRFTSNSAP